MYYNYYDFIIEYILAESKDLLIIKSKKKSIMAEEIGLIILNETMQQLPLFATLQAGFDFLKIIVGGIFGFYVLSFLIGLYYRLKEIKLLKNIDAKMDVLSKRIDDMERIKTKKR